MNLMALAFGHASGEKPGSDTRRVFQKLLDVTFCLDRVLMDAQPILDRSCGLDKTSSGFTGGPDGESADGVTRSVDRPRRRPLRPLADLLLTEA